MLSHYLTCLSNIINIYTMISRNCKDLLYPARYKKRLSIMTQKKQPSTADNNVSDKFERFVTSWRLIPTVYGSLSGLRIHNSKTKILTFKSNTNSSQSRKLPDVKHAHGAQSNHGNTIIINDQHKQTIASEAYLSRKLPIARPDGKFSISN